MNVLRTVAFCTLVLSAGPVCAQARPSVKNEPRKSAVADEKRRNDQPGTAQSPAVVRIVPPESTESQRKDAAEDKDEHADNEHLTRVATVALAWITFALAVGTVFVAAYTRGLWQYTRKLAVDGKRTMTQQIRLTRDAATLARVDFEAEHRPWIGVEIEPFQPLLFKPDGTGFIYLHFAFRNAGRVPAMQLWADYMFVPPSDDPVEAQRSVVERLERRAAEPRPPGMSIVPGAEPATLNLHYDIAAHVVSAWREWRKLNPDPRYERKTHIAGCVIYRSPLDKIIHHTGFIRELHRFRQTSFGPELHPIDPDTPSLNHGEQMTSGSVFGGGMID